MLNEQAKRLLEAPTVTLTEQGKDTYPRVLAQRDRDDGALEVTMALPGLRRVRVWVPETAWVNGEHLAMHPALARSAQRVNPLPDHHSGTG